MIENVKNIGQILIPANQAASGRAQTPGTKRFSVDENQNTPDRKASEISSDDNSSRNVNDGSEVNKNAADRNSYDEPKSKVENNKTKNQRTEGHKKANKSSDKELQENEQVNPQTENVDNNPNQNESTEQDETVNEDILDALDQSNTVTGQAVKSEEIKALQETESEQLGIKTVLPQDSNGENGLKQVVSSSDSEQVSANTAELENAQNNSELLANENSEQITTETFANKTNQEVKDVFGKVQDEKNAASEIIDEGKNKIDELIGEMKPAPRVANVIEKYEKGVSNSENPVEQQLVDSASDATQTAFEGNNLLKEGKDDTGDILKNKTEIADILASDIQNNNESTQLLNDNKMAVEQSFANTQTNEVQQTSTIASDKVDSNILKANSDGDVTAQISKHVTESISGSAIPQGGEKEITVRLSPPELGNVTIKFNEKNGELSGTLQVSKLETKHEIENAMPDIIKNLADSGIHIKRIEIVSTENKVSTNDSSKEQFAQGDNAEHFGQNDSQNQNSGAGDFNGSRFQQWFSNTIEYARGYSAQNQYASGSINMLA